MTEHSEGLTQYFAHQEAKQEAARAATQAWQANALERAFAQCDPDGDRRASVQRIEDERQTLTEQLTSTQAELQRVLRERPITAAAAAEWIATRNRLEIEAEQLTGKLAAAQAAHTAATATLQGTLYAAVTALYQEAAKRPEAIREQRRAEVARAEQEAGNWRGLQLRVERGQVEL